MATSSATIEEVAALISNCCGTHYVRRPVIAVSTTEPVGRILRRKASTVPASQQAANRTLSGSNEGGDPNQSMSMSKVLGKSGGGSPTAGGDQPWEGGAGSPTAAAVDEITARVQSLKTSLAGKKPYAVVHGLSMFLDRFCSCENYGTTHDGNHVENLGQSLTEIVESTEFLAWPDLKNLAKLLPDIEVKFEDKIPATRRAKLTQIRDFVVALVRSYHPREDPEAATLMSRTLLTTLADRSTALQLRLNVATIIGGLFQSRYFAGDVFGTLCGIFSNTLGGIATPEMAIALGSLLASAGTKVNNEKVPSAAAELRKLLHKSDIFLPPPPVKTNSSSQLLRHHHADPMAAGGVARNGLLPSPPPSSTAGAVGGPLGSMERISRLPPPPTSHPSLPPGTIGGYSSSTSTYSQGGGMMGTGGYSSNAHTVSGNTRSNTSPSPTTSTPQQATTSQGMLNDNGPDEELPTDALSVEHEKKHNVQVPKTLPAPPTFHRQIPDLPPPPTTHHHLPPMPGDDDELMPAHPKLLSASDITTTTSNSDDEDYTTSSASVSYNNRSKGGFSSSTAGGPPGGYSPHHFAAAGGSTTPRKIETTQPPETNDTLLGTSRGALEGVPARETQEQQGEIWRRAEDDGSSTNKRVEDETPLTERFSQLGSAGVAGTSSSSSASTAAVATGGSGTNLLAANSKLSGSLKEERLSRTVYISRMDPTITAATLRNFLLGCGQFYRVRLCGDNCSRTRFGFVEFADRSSAKTMCGHSGTMLGNDTIRCGPARKPIQDNEPRDAVIDSRRGVVRACLFGLQVSQDQLDQFALNRSAALSKSRDGGGGNTNNSSVGPSRSNFSTSGSAPFGAGGSRQHSFKNYNDNNNNKNRSTNNGNSSSKGRSQGGKATNFRSGGKGPVRVALSKEKD